MTVAELIAQLSQLPPTARVLLPDRWSAGFLYQNVTAAEPIKVSKDKCMAGASSPRRGWPTATIRTR